VVSPRSRCQTLLTAARRNRELTVSLPRSGRDKPDRLRTHQCPEWQRRRPSQHLLHWRTRARSSHGRKIPLAVSASGLHDYGEFLPTLITALRTIFRLRAVCFWLAVGRTW
jgi:hypothetical protein